MMAFNIATAKPIDSQQNDSGQFDLSSAQPAQQDEGAFNAFTSSIKRGASQVAMGLTQKVLEFNKLSDDHDIEKLEVGMKSGVIPETPENISKLEELKKSSATKQTAIDLAKGYEASQREKFAPIQEQHPKSAFAGNVIGQIAEAPIPAIRAGLALQMAKGATEGAALGYAQPTVEGESSAENAGVGGLIGGGVPAVLRPVTKAIGGAYRALTGQASGDAAQVAKYADENNLPLMTSDVAPPSTPLGQAAQVASEKIPFVGVGGQRSAQQTAREGVVSDLTQSYGVPNDKEIIDSLARKSGKLEEAAGKRYQSIIDAMGDTAIPLTNTEKAIDSQIKKYTQNGAIANEKVINALQSVKDQMLSGDNNLKLLRQNRTTFRELFKDESGVVSDSGNRAINAVYNGITADMKQGVAQKLGQDAERGMNQADAIWAREENIIKNTKLKNILSKGDVKPDIVRGMLFGQSPSEVKVLFNSLDTAGRDNARASILNKVFESSKESPDIFLNKLTSPQYKAAVDTFFKGEDKGALMGALNYLKYTKQAARSAANPINGAQIAQVGIPAVSFGAYHFGGIPALAGVVSAGAAARIYESKPVRNLLLKMASTPKASTQFEKISSQLEAELNRAATRVNGSKEKEVKQ